MTTTSTRPRRLLTAATLALLLTAGAAACGGSGGSEGATDTTTTTRVDKTTTTASTTTTAGEATTTTTEAGVTTTTGDETTTTTEAATTTTEARVTTTTNGEPSGDAQDYVDALVATIEGDEGEEVFEPGQVECLAGNFVDVIGVEALQSAGVSPEEFAQGNGSNFPPELGVDEAKANELYDQFAACEVDLAEVFTKAFSSGGGEVTAEQQACIDDVFTQANLRASFVADYLGDDLADDPLEAAGVCLDEPPTTEPATPTVPSND